MKSIFVIEFVKMGMKKIEWLKITTMNQYIVNDYGIS